MNKKSAVTEGICVNLKVGYLSFASWAMIQTVFLNLGVLLLLFGFFFFLTTEIFFVRLKAGTERKQIFSGVNKYGSHESLA